MHYLPTVGEIDGFQSTAPAIFIGKRLDMPTQGIWGEITHGVGGYRRGVLCHLGKFCLTHQTSIA